MLTAKINNGHTEVYTLGTATELVADYAVLGKALSDIITSELKVSKKIVKEILMESLEISLKDRNTDR